MALKNVFSASLLLEEFLWNLCNKTHIPGTFSKTYYQFKLIKQSLIIDLKLVRHCCKFASSFFKYHAFQHFLFALELLSVNGNKKYH